MIMILLCVGCTGCSGVSQVTVTTEQNDLMAEYVAGVLLKYSYDNEWEYSKINKSKAVPSKKNSSSVSATKEVTTNKTTGSANTSGSSTSNTSATSANATVAPATTADPMEVLVQGLGISGAKIAYSKYVVGDTYPKENLVLSAPATKGNKVVAIEFEISNPTAAPIVCNTVTNSASLKLTVNGTTAVSETYTILKNDIINLNNVTISPNGKTTATAIFMVPEAAANNISSLSLSVSAKGGAAVSKKIV